MNKKAYNKIISFICMFVLSISLLNVTTVNAETIKDITEETVDYLTFENGEVNNEVEEGVSGNKEVTLFHTNDTHSRVESFPKMQAYIKAYGSEYLLVDAGDTFHGQTFATLENGKSVAKILNAMNYDAMVPGNHDFNYGQETLTELSKEADITVLADNITKDGKNVFESTMMKEVNGVNVGLIGLATPETAYKTNPVNVVGLDFGTKESIIANPQEKVDALRTQGADVIVVLSHLGIDTTSDIKATDIGEAVTGIDVIIDGHSHSTLAKYADFNATHETKITSTGSYLEAFGKVRVVLNEENEVIDVILESVTSSELKEEDTDIRNLIDEIKKGQEPILNEVVGETPIDLDGVRANVRSGHTNLGRLITSAMLDETGADIAISNGGGIRDSIKAGQITKGDVISVLPFGNYIVTKNVKGQDIIDALNATMAELNGGFPHFAGMNVLTEQYEDESGTIRWRVVSIEVNGEEIEADKMYTLATNDFMAAGGDNYTMFGEYPILNEYSALDEALIKYISKVGQEGILAADSEIRLAEAEIIAMESLKEKLKSAVNEGFEVELRMHTDERTLVILTKSGERSEFLADGALAEVESVLKEVKDEMEEGNPVPPTDEEDKDEPSVDVKPEGGAGSGNGTGSGTGSGSGNGIGNGTGSGNEAGTDAGKGDVTLPQTGGTNAVVPVALGLILALAGAGVYKKKSA